MSATELLALEQVPIADEVRRDSDFSHKTVW
jgi:hypothetical protein